MAIVYLESSQVGDIADAGRWDSVGGAYAYSTDTPRTSPRCMESQFGDLRSIVKNIAANDTYIIGFAYRPSGISGTAFNLINLRDSGTAQVVVEQNTNGTLEVKNGSGTTLATTTETIVGGAYQYVEFKVTVHDTTGSFELRLNGQTAVSGTNVDTQNTGTTDIDSFVLSTHGDGSSVTYRFDDLYIADDTGGVNDDFLGDIAIEALAPDGDGNSSDLTPQGGGVNYVEVDELNASDDDTTYVESGTVGHKDTYTYGNLAMTTGSIVGVVVNAWGKKDVAADRSVVVVARSGASETDSAPNALDTTYAYHAGVFDTDPDGGGAWDITAVNAAEFGVKVA